MVNTSSVPNEKAVRTTGPKPEVLTASDKSNINISAVVIDTELNSIAQFEPVLLGPAAAVIFMKCGETHSHFGVGVGQSPDRPNKEYPTGDFEREPNEENEEKNEQKYEQKNEDFGEQASEKESETMEETNKDERSEFRSECNEDQDERSEQNSKLTSEQIESLKWRFVPQRINFNGEYVYVKEKEGAEDAIVGNYTLYIRIPIDKENLQKKITVNDRKNVYFLSKLLSPVFKGPNA